MTSPSREQVAHEEIGHTTVTPAVARGLVAAFLLLVCTIPAYELVRMALGDESARAPGARLGRMPADVAAADGLFAVNRRVLEGLHEFETTLEDEASVGHLLRPRIQALLAGAAGAGNEQVYIGRENWLFYRADVESVTSRGFLHEDVQARRVRTVDEWMDPPHPDPRPAIRRFRDDLAARGIALIVMPIPLKPSVHPEMLAAAAEGVPQNPDYDDLLAALRADGITVFDPTDMLVEARRTSGASQYLATDTHWRPEAMELAAERLAAMIAGTVATVPLADPGYRVESAEVTHFGDVLGMLDLPQNQRVYEPETVTVRRVVGADGSPWRSSPDADVLVLGDSFANIYSLESMGWGTGAGLVEQVSYILRRPVDRLVQNDAGAYATREMLMRASPERLAAKKVVIWQFAAREFVFGDWR